MEQQIQLQSLADHCLQQMQTLLGSAAWRDCHRILIAYSGGLDSAMLLECMALLKRQGKLDQRTLKAVHVHHGLASEADDWLAHCEQKSAELGVEFSGTRVQLPAKTLRQAGGLESAARVARYDVFEQHMKPGDILLQGHHLDDQAETLLLRLMRGAGPKGLAGIPPLRVLGEGFVLRPLLDVAKQQLTAAAQALELNWVEDSSNQDVAIERNYLRQEVMPLLQARWPGFAERWSVTANLCRENEAQLASFLGQQLQHCQWREERMGCSLLLSGLREVPQAQQWILIRHALQEQGLAMPSRAQLEQISQQLIYAQRLDSEAMVNTGVCCFASYKNRLYYWPNHSVEALIAVQWDTRKGLNLGGGWQLKAEEIPLEQGEGAGLWLPVEVSVTSRKDFKRAKPCGRRHSQTTKKLLQERELEPWLRDYVPFVSWQQQLLAVGDLWCEAGGQDHCQSVSQARFCRLIWRHQSADGAR